MSGMEPILIGAAVGAGTSALTGGNPLTGAALGGVTGGLGGAGGLFGGAGSGAAGGLKVTGNALAQSAAGSLDDIGLAGINKSLGNASSIGFKAAPDYFTSSVPLSPTAASMGGGFRLPTDTSMLGIREGEWNWLKDYMPSGQAIGNLGINMAAQSLMRPPVQAPAGGITPGRAPDMSAVQGLISTMRRRGQEIPSDYFG